MHGFTLVELLCVVAIISILIALGFSGYQSLRIASMQAGGISNLRQLHVMFVQYSNDNDGNLPLGGGDTSGTGRNDLSWVNRLLPYAGRPDLAEVNLNDMWWQPPSPVFKDPGVDLPGEHLLLEGNTQDAMWGFGYNIQPLLPDSDIRNAAWGGQPPPVFKLSTITKPSSRMLVASAYKWFMNQWVGNRAYNRYGKDRALCLFFDGHVSTVTQTEYDKAWLDP